jgi:hypothetical protein
MVNDSSSIMTLTYKYSIHSKRTFIRTFEPYTVVKPTVAVPESRPRFLPRFSLLGQIEHPSSHKATPCDKRTAKSVTALVPEDSRVVTASQSATKPGIGIPRWHRPARAEQGSSADWYTSEGARGSESHKPVQDAKCGVVFNREAELCKNVV